MAATKYVSQQEYMPGKLACSVMQVSRSGMQDYIAHAHKFLLGKDQNERWRA